MMTPSKLKSAPTSMAWVATTTVRSSPSTSRSGSTSCSMLSSTRSRSSGRILPVIKWLWKPASNRLR